MHDKSAKCGDCCDRSRSPSAFSVIEVFVVLGILVVLAAFLMPAMRSAGPAARRTQCTNNLKNIALAFYNYEQEYHAFPPAYTVDARGNRLHSWRTLILPYLDHKALYKQIDLSKRWDDPTNAEAFKTSVGIYTCTEAKCPPNHTTYLAVVGPSSCVQPTKPRPLSEIVENRRGETLIVIEVDSDHSVPWMAPQDTDEDLVVGLGPNTKLPHADGVNAAFADGTVRFLSAETPVAERRALCSIAGKGK